MRHKILYTILLISITFGVSAQEVLTLERARELAIENNHNMKIAEKTIEKADAERKAVRTMYLPSISASATMAYLTNTFKQDLYLPTFKLDPMSGQLVPDYFYHPITGHPIYGPDGNPVFNSYGYMPLELTLKGAYLAGVNLQQPIFAGGKIITGNKMAKLGKQMAEENMSLQEMNAIFESDKAYWTYVSVNEKVKLASQALDMLDSLVNFVRKSVDIGLVHQNELGKVMVKHNQATLDLQKARSGLSLSKMALCQALGLEFNTDIVVADTVIDCSSEVLSMIGNEDVTQRPEYSLMMKQIDMQNEQVKMNRADFLPTFGVSAGYSWIGGIEITGMEQKSNGFNIMASLKIPLFHWGEGIHKVKSAKAERDIKNLELEKNSRLLSLETEKAKLDLQDAFMRISICETALKQASENLELSQTRYELGAELLTDLLISQTQWQEAHSNLIDAKTEFKTKLTYYQKATGQLAMSNEQ